jgi:hypothetical protein
MDYKTDMAQYIVSIFNHYLPIVFSWGIHNMRAIDYGLRFRVQGFLFTGVVEVVYVAGADVFSVRLLNKDGSIRKQEDNVYLDCLVNIIDGLVEKTDDYESRVNAEYGWK